MLLLPFEARRTILRSFHRRNAWRFLLHYSMNASYSSRMEQRRLKIAVVRNWHASLYKINWSMEQMEHSLQWKFSFSAVHHHEIPHLQQSKSRWPSIAPELLSWPHCQNSKHTHREMCQFDQLPIFCSARCLKGWSSRSTKNMLPSLSYAQHSHTHKYNISDAMLLLSCIMPFLLVAREKKVSCPAAAAAATTEAHRVQCAPIWPTRQKWS